jgi:hypothetical protein
MVQAQGLPPSDSYRILQLDPRAPRELVVEAYWALVRRARRHVGESGGTSRVEALNAAYASVMTGRAAGAPQAPPADHYAVLCIDPSADSEIIEMARSVLLAQARRLQANAQRDMIEDAYRTLSHPQRRAAYDAARESAPSVDAGAASGTALDTAPQPPSQREMSRRGPFWRRKGERERPEDARLRALRDDPAFVDVPVAERPYPADAPEHDSVDPPRTAGGELVFTSGSRAGECVSIDDSVSVEGAPGRDGRAREIARVWQRDGRFFLSQTSRGDVRIGGKRLAMGLVVLDDGDEIEIGPSTMRFRVVAD